MKIAITGSAGFIGSHLCKALAGDHGIVPVSRASHGDFEAIQNWAQIFKDCDSVIHLAARVHRTDERRQDPALYDYANALLTENILEGAIAAGVKNFIFPSTAGVYGDAAAPANENSALNPLNAHADSKQKAEEIIMARGNQVRPVILRPPLTYGPGCRANFLALARAVKKGIPLPLASVDNARSFLYIGNLCSFVARALEDEQIRGVYNLADEDALSTPALIREMAAIMGVKERLFPFPVPALHGTFCALGYRRQIDGLTGSFLLDCARAKSAGWSPPFSVHEGLKRSLSHRA